MGDPGSHQFRISARHGQKAAIRLQHISASDRLAQLSFRSTCGEHITPQQHSPS
jgi:hypothetical protein